MGGSFWEFGSPDWDKTELMLLFGVAEDHDSNPIKRGLGKLKNRGAKVIAINPVRTGYNSVADQWLGIRPGTDGLLVLSIVHTLLKKKKIDLDYLQSFTNSPFLVSITSTNGSKGLFLKDKEGCPLVIDHFSGELKRFSDKGVRPSLTKSYSNEDGSYKTVFSLLTEKYLDNAYSPKLVAPQCGLKEEQILRLADDIATTAFNKSINIDQSLSLIHI